MAEERKERKRTSRPWIPLTVSLSSPNFKLFKPVTAAPSTSASFSPAAKSIAATLPLSLLFNIVGSTSLYNAKSPLAETMTPLSFDLRYSTRSSNKSGLIASG
jgi:hypothetical protein